MIPGTIRTCFPHLHPQQLSFYFSAAVTGFIHVREMSGKFKFFQGQGILREFCDMSGKDEILQKCLGILHFNLMKLECLIPMYLFFFFLLNS